tara:strand:+ start:45 stop:479 length:435 start_codon:yes stop_codon:yes gene_type:complete
VAELILRKGGVALRKALKLDGMEVDEVPSARARLAEEKALSAKLKVEKEATEVAARKIQEAHRKLLERNKTKAAEKKAAVKAAKEKEKELMKEKLSARIAEAKAGVTAEKKRLREVAEAAAEAKFEERLQRARARARAVESAAK